MKQFWDSKDSNLVVNDRITETGMIAYWNAVDTSVKFNITHREQFVAKMVNPKPSTSQVKVEKDFVPDFFAKRRNYDESRRETQEDRDFGRGGRFYGYCDGNGRYTKNYHDHHG